MNIHGISKEEVLARLVTTSEGLSSEEAGRRLAEFGPNELKEAGKKRWFIRFLSQFTHFLAVLLWVGAGLCFISEFMRPGEGMLTLGLAIAGVIVINGSFSFFQEYRAERAFEALRRLLPFKVRAVRQGQEIALNSRDIVPGDLITLSEGDKVPADARIIEAVGIKADHSSLTGESEPAFRSDAPYGGEFMDSPNIAFAGTTVISGSGRAVVFATGMRTEFGRIAHLTSAVEPDMSPLQKEIVKATRIVAVIAVVMGVVFFVIGHLAGRSFWENYIFAIGIIVANVPEGLLPTVTLALAMGSQRMAKRKALIKTLTAVETLGSVTVICTDKTGTLTQNKMKARLMWAGGMIKDAIKGGPEDELLLRAAYLCNNASYRDGKYFGEPTEAALLEAARGALGDVQAERLNEIPFDPDRKRMTTVNSLMGKAMSFTKGAAEGILPLCGRMNVNGDSVPLDDRGRERINGAYHELMDKGLRVLAFAYKELKEGEEPEQDMIFAGLVGLEDPPRPEVPEAIARCREAGIRVMMITGDAGKTAIAIGREIGLYKGNPVVIEGREFLKMSDAELREKLAGPEVLFARMTPKHKMRVVSVLKDEGERVAVTGDGVNDAPALKKADIGVAMGVSGADVAKEAADMILLDDNFATIVNAVEEGRGVYENIRKFISYILSSNIPEIVPYIAYSIFKIPLPLTIMQILAVDLGTDMLPALALGAEKPTRRLMKEPPRKKDERLLNMKLLGRAYLFLGPIEAVAAMSAFFLVMDSGGWRWGQMPPLNDQLYMQATTACLVAIIISQVGNVFACRSSRESVFSMGFFSNRLIFAGIAAELLLASFITYHPWGNRIFSAAPISLNIWLYLIPFAFVLLFAEELRKLVMRKKAYR